MLVKEVIVPVNDYGPDTIDAESGNEISGLIGLPFETTSI